MNNKTRFMTVLFSATENGDEELTNQIAKDIQSAKENGSFEDENGEMSYEDLGDKGVLARDMGNGECTLIHNTTIQSGDDVFIDLEKIPEYCVEDLSHPEVDEANGSFVYNPMDEKEFSVSTDNTAVLKIFSSQDMVETVSESVYESEQSAQVGDLKFDKDSYDDGIIVTDLSSGDQAKVELDGENMKVTELDQKNFKNYSNTTNMDVIRRKVFSNAEQYEPIFVVGIDPINKVLVNSPVYGEMAAQDLAQKLMERGLVGVNIFANPDEGREYAISLLCGEGAEEVADEEEMEVAYSDTSVIANRYFSDRTRFMNRLFSEAEENVADHQELVESAIEDGEQLETEDFIITPVDNSTAVVEDKDNGEYTVAELDGEDINVDEISEEDAMEMMQDIEVEDEQKEYADKAGFIKKGSNWMSNKGKSLKDWGLRQVKKKYKNALPSQASGQSVSEALNLKGKTAKAVGEFIETHPKSAAAIATAATTAGVGGTAYGAKKLLQKDNSELYQNEYADSDEKKSNIIRKTADKIKGAGSKIVDFAKSKGSKMSESDKKVVKKVGELIEKNPKAATAMAATIATGTAAGMAYGGKKAYDKYKSRNEGADESMYSDVDDATLAQIEDSSVEAIQNVQEAAETAIDAINQAKNAPVETVDDIKEATYSEKVFSDLNNPSLSELAW